MNNKFCFAFLFAVFLFGFSFAQPTITVEEVLQMALQKNYDIQVARTTAATQFTDKRFIYGAFIPTINGFGSYLFNNVNVRNTPWTGSEVIKNNVGSISENPNVQLVWTLFDGTKMFATRQRLLQLAELGEVNVRNQMMNTTAATMTNFYNIVRQQEQLKAIQEV